MKAKTNITKTLWLFVLAVCMTSMGAVEVRAQGNSGSTGESGSRAGTSGAQELLVPLTANYASLGGATTSGMQNASGLEALFANPAGLAVNDGTSAMFSRVEYVAGIGINYLGLAQNMGYNNIAITITSWDFGDIAEQTEIAPEVTDVSFNINYLTAGVSYSRQLTDRIAAGATIKLISENIDDVTANAVAFDAGMTYDITGSGLRLGVALKNIGNELQFTGAGLRRQVRLPGQDPTANNNTVTIESEGVQLPTLLNVGLSYTRDLGANAVVTAMGNFRSNSFDEDQFAGGIELGVMDIVYLRGGYQLTEDLDATFFSGPSFGAGLKLDLGGTQLHVDYAYQTTDFFSDVQYITASVKL